MTAPAALQTSNSNEWYTPSVYVDAAREVMGGIQLDPASCDWANEHLIHAERYYTIETDGLNSPWIASSVFLNPPYGRRDGKTGPPNAGLWSSRLVDEWKNGHVQQAILLVNANTGDAWFQKLWDYPMCFTRRIHFINAEGQPNSPTQGNVFVYLPYCFDGGNHIRRFERVFSTLGHVVRNGWQI